VRRPYRDRYEPFPRWGFVLLALTLVLDVAAVVVAQWQHTTRDGVGCGSALFAKEGLPDCDQVIADAQQWAGPLAVFAAVFTIASIVTLSTRAWIKLAPSPGWSRH